MSKESSWERLKTQIETGGMLEIGLASSALLEALSAEDGYYHQDDYIEELERLFLQPKIQWAGSSIEYHNLAVDLSKMGRNHLACVVLEKGLDEYPSSVDLLGDYLNYGVNDVQWEQCEKCYQVLKSLGRNEWNWRAYSFSIDYLLEKRKKTISVSERKALRGEILRLTKAFVEKEGSDLAYFDLANVYNSFNNKKEEKAALEAAIAKNTFSPRCSLRLADIEISKGDYLSALERLKTCEIAFRPQLDVNLAYVYLLKVLSKSSLLLSKILKNRESSSTYQEDAYSIYRDYNSAIAIGLDGIMQKTASAVIAVIENQTEVKNTIMQIDAPEF